MRTLVETGTAFLVLLSAIAMGGTALAAPAAPSGSHPRLFMSAGELAGYTAKASDAKSAVSGQIARCDETITHPEWYTERGGADGDNWPGAAVACALAYHVTQKTQYLTQAIKYWQAALDDDQTLGDKLGCVAGVATDWQTWAAAGAQGTRPPVILTITHDTGYPIRWYGPDIALTYDWLYDAPGVGDGLRAQTRTCLTAWLDYYSRYGYNRDLPGANYNAGFVAAKALGAIAIGTDGGFDGHLWTEVVDDQFGKQIIGQALAGANGRVGEPAGAMVGGDAMEGWQYGPLSVTEYAVSARALEENGASLPEMHAWTDSLMVRYVYGLVPAQDGQWVGGDFDSTEIYQGPGSGPINAVLAGPSSELAAGWATSMRQKLSLGFGTFIYAILAEQRDVATQDYTTQTPAPALWYLARGTRAMYVRTGWSADAFWGVFTSPPYWGDHQHFSASNFVFTRGADHLIVDSSQYGAPNTLQTNAVSADAVVVPGDYAKSQTPWSEAELPWARASDANVFAARSDFARAFNFNGKASDIPYARREWVFLPEGEVVAIDRVETADAAHVMYVNFHANTAGTLKIGDGVAAGAAGGSRVVIHPVKLSGGAPVIESPASLSDSSDCTQNYPAGACTNARFPVDIYAVKVPGPAALAIHVIDGLAAAESPATVASVNDPNYDPAGENTGVIGAAVYRADKQSYVIASSAPRGAAGAVMSYGVPGTTARHIVFDAPEASDGTSTVSAQVQDGRCAVTITSGSGGGFAGQPLMFSVDGANACAVVESTNVATATPPPLPTPIELPKGKGGCGCSLVPAAPPLPMWIVAAVLVALWLRRRRLPDKRICYHCPLVP